MILNKGIKDHFDKILKIVIFNVLLFSWLINKSSLLLNFPSTISLYLVFRFGLMLLIFRRFNLNNKNRKKSNLSLLILELIFYYQNI